LLYPNADIFLIRSLIRAWVKSYLHWYECVQSAEKCWRINPHNTTQHIPTTMQWKEERKGVSGWLFIAKTISFPLLGRFNYILKLTILLEIVFVNTNLKVFFSIFSTIHNNDQSCTFISKQIVFTCTNWNNFIKYAPDCEWN